MLDTSECYAAKTNIFLPLGAEKSGAEEGEDVNVTIVKVAGVTMGVGAHIGLSHIGLLFVFRLLPSFALSLRGAMIIRYIMQIQY